MLTSVEARQKYDFPVQKSWFFCNKTIISVPLVYQTIGK